MPKNALCLLLPAVFTKAPEGSPQPEYCAFEAKVSNSASLPSPQLEVAMVLNIDSPQDRVTVHRAYTDERWIARLYEAPLGRVAIMTGEDFCGVVSVRNLSAEWPSTRYVHMTFDKPPCERFAFSDSCLLLLRVLDVKGSPVSHAELSLPRAKDKTDGPAAETDSFGWNYRTLAVGETLEGSIAKAGVGRTGFRERCDPKVSPRIERTVHVQPAK